MILKWKNQQLILKNLCYVKFVYKSNNSCFDLEIICLNNVLYKTNKSEYNWKNCVFNNSYCNIGTITNTNNKFLVYYSYSYYILKNFNIDFYKPETIKPDILGYFINQF